MLATEPEPGTDQEEEKKEKERKTSVLDSKPNWKENSFSAAAAADGLDSISAEILDEENFRKFLLKFNFDSKNVFQKKETNEITASDFFNCCLDR